MRPITIVKRFLKGETPSIPIPPGIEDEVVSNPSTASWLLISQSSARQQSNPITSTNEAECQTMSALQPFYSRPRACIKRSLGLSGDTPLPAPSFLPRSKVPKLNVGALQTPKLYCFARSMLSSPTSFRKIFYCITVNGRQTFLNQNELVLNLDIFTKSNSLPNSFVKFTIWNFWTNTLIASQTAWVQEALWPACKSGITGPAGANAITKSQLKHHFHSYWIISMLQIT